MTTTVADVDAAGQATAYLQERLKGRPQPTVGVICGSGLARLSEAIRPETKLSISFSEIPCFPYLGVAGHHAELVFGSIGASEVAVVRGRAHSYEGHSMQTVVLATRVFAKLGVAVLIVTNAAGGIRRDFNVGDIMVITDHIGLPVLAGKGPLVGPNIDSLGPRFPAMSNAYSPRLRNICASAAAQLGMTGFVRPSGTYFFVSGPAYETAAESAMIRLLGGDAVGMSTVPEVQAARHAGMEVLGLSLISNVVVLPGDESATPANHLEVLQATQAREKDVMALVVRVIDRIAEADPGPPPPPPPPLAAVQSKRGAAEDEVATRLRNTDVSLLTPMDAMRLLVELKTLLL